ncbi:FTR1 family protein [Ureibacillus sp. FSL K6-3587]|uniref:FTR1 family iron permease n=1 Tax=Ureibacillus sp. FSL K6-3587 TaxID=2954681 RepID=UPI003157FFF2
MKHFLKRCSLICILLLTFVLPVRAETSYSSFYITISDALMNTKQGNGEKAEAAIDRFTKEWESVESSETKEKEAVNKALQKVQKATNKDERIAALKELSTALRILEEKENPIDEKAQREEFARKITPALERFENALATGDLEQIEAAYNTFNTKWNQNERPVRDFSTAMYGEIETQMAFIRMSIASETADIATIQEQYAMLKQKIEDFIAGKETAQAVEGDYSIETLVQYIDEAIKHIGEKHYAEAAASIQKFIIIWPQVEQEVSTRNGSLYTKIESDMPMIANSLMKSNVDAEHITQNLKKFKTEIELLKADTNYSFWDSAMILLREGLEALLIIVALAAFLKKSGQQAMEKWIYIGALLGVVCSIVAAVLMSTVLNSATVDSNREVLEGYIGLAAAAMMIGVGVWLHNKSSVESWNRYISNQMNQAISTGSVVSMAAVSFLSVFREGAETIVFYIGILPKMEMSQFLLGIAMALAILAATAVVLMKVSGKIPVHKFFIVATIFIYLLAFKIIGGSMHTLQLQGRLDTTVVDGLPVLSTVGFYPTFETIIGQAVLILLILATIIYKRFIKPNAVMVRKPK